MPENLQTAFLRLQEEIIKKSDDTWILAWQVREPPRSSRDWDGKVIGLRYGLLATSVSAFAASGRIIHDENAAPVAWSMTHKGLDLQLELRGSADSEYEANVGCIHLDKAGYVAVGLKEAFGTESPKQYIRMSSSWFTTFDRGVVERIRVPQSLSKYRIHSLTRRHAFQIGVTENHSSDLIYDLEVGDAVYRHNQMRHHRGYLAWAHQYAYELNLDNPIVLAVFIFRSIRSAVEVQLTLALKAKREPTVGATTALSIPNSNAVFFDIRELERKSDDVLNIESSEMEARLKCAASGAWAVNGSRVHRAKVDYDPRNARVLSGGICFDIRLDLRVKPEFIHSSIGTIY